MGQAVPAIIMAVAAVGSAAMQNESSRKAQSAAKKEAQRNRDWYEKISMPDPEAIKMAEKQRSGELAGARSQSYQSLAENLSTRGFGPGSGLHVKGASEIESGYGKSLGDMYTELTKFANTRQFAPGSGTANSQSLAAQLAGAGWGLGADSLNTIGGYTGMANALQGAGNDYTISAMEYPDLAGLSVGY
jgi:hypothetical protein